MKRPQEWPDAPAESTYMYDKIVFIGRFEPPTKAHIETITQALRYGERVIIVAGSAFQPRTIKNPWSVADREEMIHNCFSADESWRISVIGVEDHIYNDNMWLRDVQRAVNQQPDEKIGIIGHSKDDSSYYLAMFPQWDPLEMENIDDINATDVREMYFNPLWTLHQGGSLFEKNVKDKLPPAIAEYLMNFKETEAYSNLAQEADFFNKYKQQWANVPYPVTFVTTDAVVVQSGHILLVKRRSNPGAGTFALPGGFIGQNERLIDSMIRELREETKLRVPIPILKGSIVRNKVYDHPDRSLRGRTITHAYVIELPPGPLSTVKGSDDAQKAKWVPVQNIRDMQNVLFEDHYSIITDLLGTAT